jgi:eukaryotic-like serine/threonine-protein kinase
MLEMEMSKRPASMRIIKQELQRLLAQQMAHPFSGTTSVHSPVNLVPERATILNQSLYKYRGHNGSVTAVAWSPKGQIIASTDMLDSSVQVWEAYTGNLVVIPGKDVFAVFATNSKRVDALAWSPDSLHIAAALCDDAVDIWSIETGDLRPVSFSQNSIVNDTNALAWSPDGSKIATVSYNRKNFILLLRPYSGSVHPRLVA